MIASTQEVQISEINVINFLYSLPSKYTIDDCLGCHHANLLSDVQLFQKEEAHLYEMYVSFI